MNCLLVVNTLSGNTTKLNIKSILDKHTTPQDNITIKRITRKRADWDVGGYEKVIVCGGDGTLYHALNQCSNSTVEHLVYVSCGTFNEGCRMDNLHRQVCKVGDRLFHYVLAGGSFTDIGYTTEIKKKQRYKIFAYFGRALQSYKVHNFDINISHEGKQHNTNATLAMFLQGKRCFGFNFNKLYDRNDKMMYMLIIKSFGNNTLWNRIRLFFPLFRVFFLGIRKPIDNKRIYFAPFANATVNLPQAVPFCVDGEKVDLEGTFTVCSRHPTYKLTLDRYV